MAAPTVERAELMLLKLLADRATDREDILGIAATVGQVDVRRLLEEAERLFAPDDSRLAWLRSQF